MCRSRKRTGIEVMIWLDWKRVLGSEEEQVGDRVSG